MRRYCLWLAAFVMTSIFLLPVSIHAQADDGWPVCRNVGDRLRVSPIHAIDRTLYSFRWVQSEGFQVTRSTDDGVTWSDVRGVYNGQPVMFSPGYGTTDWAIYKLGIGMHRNMLASLDGGITWTSYALPPDYGVVGEWSLAVASARSVFLASGSDLIKHTGDGLHHSPDGGATWERVWEGVEGDPLSYTWLVGVSPNYAIDQTVFHGGYTLYRSTDGGGTWTTQMEGIEARTEIDEVRQIVFSPGYAVDGTIFLIYGRRLYKSLDAGEHWQTLRPVHTGSDHSHDLIVSPDYPADHTLWLRSSIGRDAVSRDGGATWQPVTEHVEPVAAGMYRSENERLGVELFAFRYGSYKSYDYGLTWHCLESPVAPGTPGYAPPPPAPPTPLPPTEVPEPTTLVLLSSGLAGLAASIIRRRRGRLL